MKHVWHGWVIVGLAAVALVVMQQHACAATSSGSGFYLENLGVKIFSMTKNVIIPLLLLGMVVFAAGNIAFGWVQMGPDLSRLLIAGAVLAGGIETILLLVGGNVASALVLP